ncbi:hypothetical protein [Psychroserpens sp.]|jgi:hypothetical protein|uniref:hypothetical protein n=1 Tax=Psychroserpens sp. TaxID=2020870 RepID=UPI0039E26BF1
MSSNNLTGKGFLPVYKLFRFQGEAMSNYSTIYENLIKLGVKQQLAHKVSKELVEKAKLKPTLSESELKKEIEKLSKSINALNEPDKKQAINYLHAIIQGVLATGAFELLVLLRSWLSSVFMSANSPEILELAKMKGMIRQVINKQFSSDASDVITKNAMDLEKSQRTLIESSLVESGFELDEQMINVVVETLDNLYQIIEYKHAVKLGFVTES